MAFFHNKQSQTVVCDIGSVAVGIFVFSILIMENFEGRLGATGE